MTSPLDEAIRDRLRAEVEGWRPSHKFEVETVARALRTRQRRRRTLGAVAGLTTVALVVSGAMLSGVSHTPACPRTMWRADHPHNGHVLVQKRLVTQIATFPTGSSGLYREAGST